MTELIALRATAVTVAMALLHVNSVPQNLGASGNKWPYRFILSDHSDMAALDFDPTRSSLALQAAAGAPLHIPWSSSPIRLGTGFDSAAIGSSEGPWKSSYPFSVPPHVPQLLCEIDESIASYKDGLSASAGSTSEHLSASLAVTVGCDFLSASVTGDYDKAVLENRNATRASRTSTVRSGRIIFNATPSLKHAAKATATGDAGLSEVRCQYGDYYLAGLCLGADAGASVSANNSQSSKFEQKKITATVSAFLWSRSVTHTSASQEFEASMDLEFSGYATLNGQKFHQRCGLGSTNPMKSPATALAATQRAADVQSMHAAAAEYMQKVANLHKDVQVRMDALGLHHQKLLALEDCSKICQAGLVVQLVLVPFSLLRELVEISSTKKCLAGTTKITEMRMQ
ncbi:hypothetical protein H2200_003369 [Cladophialophora chaetospira]|uniref:Uncharacterized protein n=1 Tax=Cladophialophora chaetospira TaxID=386627 RepID=A0AA38XHB1_9EURO|nr:hypothetical protein H2200_003369 [Cladophialophora chaetospira]